MPHFRCGTRRKVQALVGPFCLKIPSRLDAEQLREAVLIVSGPTLTEERAT